MNTEELRRAETDFHEHLARYQAFGHDRLQAVQFVAETAGTWTGPALDIGTGKGLLATQLALSGCSVTSVDTNATEQQLAAARAEQAGVGSRVRMVTCDAAQLPFESASFGLVAMMNVLHHLDRAEPVFAEMTRVLAPGGKILIAEFDQEGFALVARIHREEGRVHAEGPVSMDIARSWLRGAGLSEVARRQGMLHDVAVFA